MLDLKPYFEFMDQVGARYGIPPEDILVVPALNVEVKDKFKEEVEMQAPASRPLAFGGQAAAAFPTEEQKDNGNGGGRRTGRGARKRIGGDRRESDEPDTE